MKKILFLTIAFLAPSIALAATLSVSPSSQNINVGDTFSISVKLDTQGTSIDGVDLRYLNYDSNLLQIQDANTSASGIQITPGSLMSMTLANSTDAGLGRITFSQVASGGNKYSGSGTLATVTFKAMAAGTAGVTFNYSSGNTTDSNVAATGSDVLTSVVNGSYVIGSSSSAGSSVSGGGGSSSSSASSGSFSNTGGGSSSSGGSSSGTSNAISTVTTYAPSGTSVFISKNLALGARGSDVTSLQNFLVKQGYLTADNATGYFGYMTQTAVQNFQKAQNIVSSGSPNSTGYGAVGPTTRARINSLGGSGTTSVMSIDEMKQKIIELQKILNALILQLNARR